MEKDKVLVPYIQYSFATSTHPSLLMIHFMRTNCFGEHKYYVHSRIYGTKSSFNYSNLKFSNQLYLTSPINFILYMLPDNPHNFSLTIIDTRLVPRGQDFTPILIQNLPPDCMLSYWRQGNVEYW